MAADFFKALRPASYRGVSFGVFSADDTRGRSTVTHEFPQRDKVYVEDLGRAPRAIDITAFVVGPDYALRRDDLLAALEKPGPATLVHPWLGSFLVSLSAPAVVSHSAENGGMATFQPKFVEDSAPESPGPGIDLPSISDLRAAAARALAALGLDSVFQWAGVTAEALAAGQAWAAGLYNLLAPIFPTAGFQPPDISDSPAVFYAQIEKAGSLSALTDDFWPALDYSRDAASAAKTADGLLNLALASETPEIPAILGSIRRQTAQNQAACLTYQREMSLLEGLRALAWLVPESRQAADALREKALTALDFSLEQASGDGFFQAAQALHASAQRALAEAAGRAPEVVSVTEAASAPALVIAWRRVLAEIEGGSIESAADDLARRNRVRHPGFVPAGDLEVLRGSV